jgi:tripartite-type tricarboxylate transporter receptor subunit TctC
MSLPAVAQQYPNKPIRLVAGFASGTTVDVLGRLLAPKLADALKQQVYVENITGASSTIAAANVARSPADGSSLLLTSTALVTSPSLFKSLPYDLERDFAPVTLLAFVHNMMVTGATSPVKDINDLISLLKAHPGKYNYASSGTGSAGHLATELFQHMAKVDVRAVQYKANSQGFIDVMRGEVLLFFPSLPSALPLVQGGKLRGLAVSGRERSAAAPDIPAMAEYLPGFEASAQFGVLVPTGTPASAVAILNREFERALRLPDIKKAMAAQGLEIASSTPEEFGMLMREGRQKWERLIRQLNLPPQG